MQIKINKKNLKDAIIALEAECSAKYGDGFCLFGQIMIKHSMIEDELELRMGVFNKEEYNKLTAIVKNRDAKEWEKTIKIKGITHGHN